MLIEYNGKKPKVSEKAFVAPDATLIGDVEVAEEASIWFGARLRGDIGKITVGARTSVQDNVVVHVFAGEKPSSGKTSPWPTGPCCTTAPWEKER